MTFSLKHAFQSAKADGADTSVVRPSDWNAEHTLSMATDRLLGRTSAGAGAVEEISVGTGLSLTAGTLSSTVTGTVTSVSGTGTVNGLTLTGSVTSSGSLTLGGTLSVDLSTATVTGTLPVTKGGTGTTTQFTAGSVVFAGASGVYTQDNANLFWDDANNRLGIKTATPTAELDVNGTINVPNQLNYDYITSVLPDVAPALNLNFVQSNVVDPRITFTRSSTATFVGSNGLIQTAAVNTPRLDYDPVTRAPKGLLIEEQRTNLLLQSQSLTTSWSSDGTATMAANQTTSPDGTVNASQLQYGTNKYRYQVATTVTSTVYAYSIYAKLGTGGNSTFTATAGSVGAVFNLSTQTTSSVTATSASITSVGNGWYRCSIVFTAAGTSTTIGFEMLGAFTTGQGHYFYGAQLEAGAFATSYIPTVASQVTRTADVATMTGTNFSNWYNQSEGTFAAEFSFIYTGARVSSAGILNFDQSGNKLVVYVPLSGTTANTYDGSTVVSSYTVAGSGVQKVASAYNSSGRAITANGNTVITGAVSATYSASSSLQIGGGIAIGAINGHIRSIQYYNTRLANTVLQGITA